MSDLTEALVSSATTTDAASTNGVAGAALADNTSPGVTATIVAPPEVEEPPSLDEPHTFEAAGRDDVPEPGSGRAAPRGGAPDRPSPPARFARRFIRGRDDDPVWVRPSLVSLLVGTAVLYIWDLGASGWANSFYGAAVQAGSKSWKAFLFGSFDSSN